MVFFTVSGDGNQVERGSSKHGLIRTIFSPCFTGPLAMEGGRSELEVYIREILLEFEGEITFVRELYNAASRAEELPTAIKARFKAMGHKYEAAMIHMVAKYEMVLHEYTINGVPEATIKYILEGIEATNRHTFKRLREEQEEINLMVQKYANNIPRRLYNLACKTLAEQVKRIVKYYLRDEQEDVPRENTLEDDA